MCVWKKLRGKWLNFARSLQNNRMAIFAYRMQGFTFRALEFCGGHNRTRRGIVILNHLPVKDAQIASWSLSFLYVSLLLSSFRCHSSFLSRAKSLCSLSSTQQMSLSAFECASLRIGHGELRTEIPSYGVTDREWSRITRGRVSSWEARKL